MIGYEYGNARLRAMRARLLTGDDYIGLMTVGSLEHLLGALADTAYAPDIAAAIPRIGGGLRRLDDALRANLARSLRSMGSFYRDDAAAKVQLLLVRWDLKNLRALIRLPSAEVGDVSGLLVPAGRLDDVALAELADQPDIRSRIDLMVAWDLPSADTARRLLRARTAFEATGDTAALELALDQAFALAMNDGLGETEGAATRILRTEIDVRNLLWALRLRDASLSSEPGPMDEPAEFLEGGVLPSSTWPLVAMADGQEEILAELGRRRLFPGWSDSLDQWAEHQDLAALSDDLRRNRTAAAISLFTSGDPLGFDIPVAFTFAKEAEVRNIWLIGRGLVHDLPLHDVEARLEGAA